MALLVGDAGEKKKKTQNQKCSCLQELSNARLSGKWNTGSQYIYCLVNVVDSHQKLF